MDELQAAVTQRLWPYWEEPSRVLCQVHHWLHAQANSLSRRIVPELNSVWYHFPVLLRRKASRSFSSAAVSASWKFAGIKDVSVSRRSFTSTLGTRAS